MANAEAILQVIIRGVDESGSKALQSFSDSAQKQTEAIGKVLLGIGASITGVAALAVKAAIDEQQSVALLSTALNNVGTSYDAQKTAIEGVIDAEVRKTNYGDEAQRSALTQLITETGNYALSLKALPVILDVAASKGMDLSSAAVVVGKALEGDTASLMRYGIELDKGATPTEVLAELTARFGGSAENAANPLLILKNNTVELFAALGTLLLPALKAITGLLVDIIKPITDFIEHTGTAGKVIADIVVGFGLFAGAAGTVLLLLPKLVAGYTALASVTGVLGGVSGIGSFGSLASTLGIAGLAIGAVTAVGVGLYFGIKQLGEGTMGMNDACKILNLTLGEALARYGDEGRAVLAANESLKTQGLTLDEWKKKQGDATVAAQANTAAMLQQRQAAIDAATAIASANATIESSVAAIVNKYNEQNSVLGKLGVTQDDLIAQAVAIGDSEYEIANSLRLAAKAAGVVNYQDLTLAQTVTALGLCMDDVTKSAKDLTNAQTELDKESQQVNDTWQGVIKTASDLYEQWQWQNSAIGKLNLSFDQIIDAYFAAGGSASYLAAEIANGTIIVGDAESAYNALSSYLGGYIASANEATVAQQALTAAQEAFTAAQEAFTAAQAAGQGTFNPNADQWQQDLWSFAQSFSAQGTSLIQGSLFDAIQTAAQAAFGSGGLPSETSVLGSIGSAISAALASINATGASAWSYVGGNADWAGTPTLTPEALDAIRAALSGMGLSFASGGIVPGALGEAIPIVAHGGERVIPNGGGDEHIHIHLGDREITDVVIDRITRRVKLQGLG